MKASRSVHSRSLASTDAPPKPDSGSAPRSRRARVPGYQPAGPAAAGPPHAPLPPAAPRRAVPRGPGPVPLPPARGRAGPRFPHLHRGAVRRHRALRTRGPAREPGGCPPLTEVIQREAALVRGPRLEALGPKIHGGRHVGEPRTATRAVRRAAGRAPSGPRESAEHVERRAATGVRPRLCRPGPAPAPQVPPLRRRTPPPPGRPHPLLTGPLPAAGTGPLAAEAPPPHHRPRPLPGPGPSWALKGPEPGCSAQSLPVSSSLTLTATQWQRPAVISL